jgi:iduronate 2-sulfatase
MKRLSDLFIGAFPFNSVTFTVALLLLPAHMVHSDEAKNTDRLNVLYIVSDDLNNNLGCYGHGVVQSPNIDRLAARAMRFDHAYCDYPVCNPSRVSFLSGLRTPSTEIFDLATPTRTHLKDAIFLPELFRKNGYRTIKVGKIFHTGDQHEDPRSWDIDIRETKQAKNPPESQILRRQGPSGIVLRANDEDTWDGFVARKAAALMEEAVAGGTDPFFMAAGFRMPHTPYIAPEKYYALYNPDTLKPRRGPVESLSQVPDSALTYRLGLNPKFPEERPGDTMAAYYSAISYMDAQVGVLLDTLDRLKLWDSTIVVFHSDHGYHLGEHGGLWHKLSLFDECARIPLLVATPACRPGSTARLVEAVDIYPTLAELCQLPAPANLEGTSFVPLLKDPTRQWKTAAFTCVSRPLERGDTKFGDLHTLGRTMFDGRWRYTQWHDGTVELYDHESDPLEYNNLAGDSRSSEQLTTMKQRLRDGWKAALPPPSK